MPATFRRSTWALSRGGHTARPRRPWLSFRRSRRTQRTQRSRGETLLVFGDGLSETSGVDDQQYGEGQLDRFLDENGRLGAEELGRSLLADVESFRSAPSAADDLTLFIVQRL